MIKHLTQEQAKNTFKDINQAEEFAKEQHVQSLKFKSVKLYAQEFLNYSIEIPIHLILYLKELKSLKKSLQKLTLRFYGLATSIFDVLGGIFVI